MRGSQCRNIVGRYIRVLDLSKRGECDFFFLFISVSWVRIMDQTACIMLSFSFLFLVSTGESGRATASSGGSVRYAYVQG